MTSRAAEALAGLIGNDMRLAAQEIEKLLAFVKYQRPVEVDDVQALTADTLQGDIFQLVDALGNQQSRQAMAMLHRLLDQQDPLTIFSMVQRQFRMLLQAREILDIGGNEAQITRQLNLHPFVAGKVTSQARRFRLAEIENIYRQLLSLDEALKTGQIPAGLGLETFVAAFKNP